MNPIEGNRFLFLSKSGNKLKAVYYEKTALPSGLRYRHLYTPYEAGPKTITFNVSGIICGC
jgi:hypothetical protein